MGASESISEDDAEASARRDEIDLSWLRLPWDELPNGCATTGGDPLAQAADVVRLGFAQSSSSTDACSQSAGEKRNGKTWSDAHAAQSPSERQICDGSSHLKECSTLDASQSCREDAQSSPDHDSHCRVTVSTWSGSSNSETSLDSLRKTKSLEEIKESGSSPILTVIPVKPGVIGFQSMELSPVVETPTPIDSQSGPRPYIRRKHRNQSAPSATLTESRDHLLTSRKKLSPNKFGSDPGVESDGSGGSSDLSVYVNYNHSKSADRGCLVPIKDPSGAVSLVEFDRVTWYMGNESDRDALLLVDASLQDSQPVPQHHQLVSALLDSTGCAADAKSPLSKAAIDFFKESRGSPVQGSKLLFRRRAQFSSGPRSPNSRSSSLESETRESTP